MSSIPLNPDPENNPGRAFATLPLELLLETPGDFLDQAQGLATKDPRVMPALVELVRISGLTRAKDRAGIRLAVACFLLGEQVTATEELNTVFDSEVPEPGAVANSTDGSNDGGEAGPLAA